MRGTIPITQDATGEMVVVGPNNPLNVTGSTAFRTAIIEHIPSGTVWSTAVPTVTASSWVQLGSWQEVLIALDTDATGGNLVVEFSHDAVTASNFSVTRAITSASGAVLSSRELEQQSNTNDPPVAELFRSFPFFRAKLTSGVGTSTTASVFVTLRGWEA